MQNQLRDCKATVLHGRLMGDLTQTEYICGNRTKVPNVGVLTKARSEVKKIILPDENVWQQLTSESNSKFKGDKLTSK